jgi:hypothetical protein
MKMTGKQLAAWVLSVTLLTPASLLAGPECKPGECPPNDYSRLHYWTPTMYVLRAYIHPSNLDQYAPGPSANIAPTFDTTKYRCPTAPAMPSSPYADPAAYFGRMPVTP